MTPLPEAARPPVCGPVHLHIERLVLEGLALDKNQARQLQRALETELGRLLAQDGYPGTAAGAIAKLPAAAVAWTGCGPAALGAQVAGGIYRSLRT